MNTDKWDFEEPWWDSDYRAIKFAAEKAGNRYICAISQIALNDYFRTEDTKEAAFANYYKHADMVHSVAIKLIQQDQPNERGVYFIASEVCNKFWS